MSPPPTTTPAPKSKHRLFIGILLGIVALGGVASFLMSDAKPHRKAAPKEQTVTILLPPPPPVVTPPPPPQKLDTPPPKEEEMVEQEPVPNDEPPPEAAPEAPPAEDIGGGNPNGNGPGVGPGGNGPGGPRNNNRIGGGSKFGWYAAKVQTTVAEALRGNASTRSAVLSLQVRIWADADGRITRATLVGSSGNSATDAALKNQVLTGLQLPQAPPAGMPMPITLRLTARKPAI